DYAFQVKKELQDAGIRVELDLRNEKLGYKIREAQLEKVPYMLVLGEQEQNSGAISVRKRGSGDAGAMSIAEFVRQIVSENAARNEEFLH
ncbi:His/Gly/Thr/Pro-type tRNA ligase C-terminal domain-containing protein, partial [Paenibacillus riograndensis]